MFCRYESDETPMVSYLNVHDGLEQRRRTAKEASTSKISGPRTIVSSCLDFQSTYVWFCVYALSVLTATAVMQIVGPVDAGKSTLGKILLNYAVRAGWAPTAVDLDIGGPFTSSKLE